MLKKSRQGPTLMGSYKHVIIRTTMYNGLLDITCNTENWNQNKKWQTSIFFFFLFLDLSCGDGSIWHMTPMSTLGLTATSWVYLTYSFVKLLYIIVVIDPTNVNV